MNYMDLLGGGLPPGFEDQMPQPQQMGGLFGGGGPPPQASQLPGVTQMPQFGQTPLQGMGLQSPFLTERPPQALPTQGFMPSRTNAMGPNAMGMLGMNPNFGNMVGPTSALPPEMQPQASQLKMWGMEDQMAQPAQSSPSANTDQLNALGLPQGMPVQSDPNEIPYNYYSRNTHLPAALIQAKWQAEANALQRGDWDRIYGRQDMSG